jgi:hypothetical protein
MNFADIRAELTGQHASLRLIIEDARMAAGRAYAQRNESTRDELRARVFELTNRLLEHNEREEQLLAGILATIDAWGSVRREIMSEQHVAEHRELTARLLVPEGESDAALARENLSTALDCILEHMAHEERMFLNDAVLQDDGLVVDSVSG